MKDIKSSIILKTICYIMVPILTLVIIINSLSLILSIEYKEDMEGYTDYFNTQKFAEDGLSVIYQATRNTIRYMNTDTDADIETETIENGSIILSIQEAGDKAKQGEDINYGLIEYLNKNILDIVIKSSDGKIYTNIEKTVKTDSYEGLKNYITQKDRKWQMVNGTIQTNLEKMKYENIAYHSYFEYIQNHAQEIYVAVRENSNSSIYMDKLSYEMVSKTYQTAPIVLAISSILLLAACVYILISIGHKKGNQGIYTNVLDKIPLEILIGIIGILLFLEVVFLENVVRTIMASIATILVSMLIVWGVLVYITLAIGGVTIVRRIKAKVFFKNSLCYEVIHYLKGGVSHFIADISKNTGRTMKLVVIVGGFTLISIMLAFWAMNSFFSFLLLVAFWYFCFRKLLKEMNKVIQIRNKIKNMYNGKIEEDLEEEKFTGEMQEVVHELNDISGGLSNAIEQGLKSERLKTELITNVSHDIKTPLTSIINYVDLLKKEEIPNEKVQEYLQILDNKSQRLKKLTEDLVEASKASSGNIKLNMEKLNVKELLKQVSGEFEDKLEEKGLQVIESVPEEEVYIQADSRYMYRVMENMYTNIVKYALENSRIYIDVTKQQDIIEIAIKNISKDKLNISADELMQRFVRGDTARTTEGSGLGISIARSLTELQKGKFDLYLDGDLFKVVIQFPNL